MASLRGAARALERPIGSVAAAFRRVEAALAVDLAFAAGSSLTFTFEARRIGTDLSHIASLAMKIARGDELEEGRRLAAARPLSLLALQHLVDTLDAGSIRTAARRLGIGQPQLSRQLAHLEDKLGTRLLDRSAEGCRPTADGERVAALASELLARWTLLTSTSARDFRRQITTLRLGSIVPLGHESQIARMLADLVAVWRQPGRRSHLMLKSSTAEELISELKAGRLDFVLVDMVIASDDLQGIEIDRSRLAVVGPVGFRERCRDPVEALRREPVAVPTARSGLRRAVHDLLDAGGERSDQTPANFTEIDSIPVIINLVREHGYLSVLPKVSVDGVIGGIEAVELSAAFDLPICLAWVKARDLGQIAAEIIRDIRS
ncbi:LysR family transcriptional regulator [Pleomorphomonas sp. PLEO]|uniref:LysR family transcriptional regulator n=1 Tax=Pleomorphomonas sp. PLEO TaxID=3239306 RepID=UPI00351DC5DE